MAREAIIRGGRTYARPAFVTGVMLVADIILTPNIMPAA